MEINRHNYEAFLLDLLEGRLSVGDQQQLNGFLLQNPDCSGEVIEAEPWVLGKEEINYPGIEHLKKVLPSPLTVLSEHNFDLFSIARLEGDLTRDQEVAHQSMISLDEIRAGQWAEWQKTRLEAEPIPFKGKDQLKHKEGNRTRIVWMSLVSAAAAIAFLLFIVLNKPVIPGQEFAQQPTIGTEKQDGIEPRDQTVPEESAAPAEAQTQREESGRQALNARRPVVNTLMKDQSLTVESETIKDTGPHDDLLPHPLKVADNKLLAVSHIAAPVQDHIGPLHIQPVPIHLNSLSLAQLSDMDLQQLVEEYSKEKNFSLWNVANAGINGINRLTGSDISLMSYRDDDGDVSGFRLKAKRFSLTRPLGQE